MHDLPAMKASTARRVGDPVSNHESTNKNFLVPSAQATCLFDDIPSLVSCRLLRYTAAMHDLPPSVAGSR